MFDIPESPRNATTPETKMAQTVSDWPLEMSVQSDTPSTCSSFDGGNDNSISVESDMLYDLDLGKIKCIIDTMPIAIK